jgi:hypothetical protein
LENTEKLRDWIHQKVASEYGGNLTTFSDNTAVSRQTWMNILNNRYRSLRQQAVDDLCSLFELTELELYLIAHPETTGSGKLREAPATYRARDEAGRLANFLRKATEKDRAFIYDAAERCGFKRSKK